MSRSRHPLDQHRFAGWNADNERINTRPPVPTWEQDISPTDPHAPLWGTVSLQRRGRFDGPFSYPFMRDGMTLIVAEWEWDTGVGYFFGEKYNLVLRPMHIISDGVTRERMTFRLRFPKNDFAIELPMDDDVQSTVMPAIQWPGEKQCEYRGHMTPDEILRLFDQVLGQKGPNDAPERPAGF